MRPALIFLAFVSLLALPARADELVVSSASHLGYGMVSRTADGTFDGTGGTLAFFDVSVPLGASVDAGLRSLAQGGKAANASFYRLGSGPFVSWEAVESLFLQLTLNGYRESILTADGTTRRAVGKTLMAGWERFFFRSARLDAGWGGFAAWHSGAIGASLTRGVDLSIRLRL